MTFTFNTVGWSKHHSTDRPVHLFLHLSIDQWRADLMASTPEGNFITHRMLPPGRTWFFFSEGEWPSIHRSSSRLRPLSVGALGVSGSYSLCEVISEGGLVSTGRRLVGS